MTDAEVFLTKQLLAERGMTNAQDALYTGTNITAKAAEGLVVQQERYGGLYTEYKSMRPWVIDDEFRWVLLVAVAISFHYTMSGFFFSS